MIEQAPFLLILGVMLLIFFILSYISKRLKIPSVLIYIVFGILLAQIITEKEILHNIANIGIVLLFFLLGLEFPLARMIEISKKVWPAGMLDVFLNLGIGFAIALFFGLDLLSAFLIGSVVYASSSSITAKMLEEKKRLASPEAEFILALLIFEDLVAPVLVSFLAGIYGGTDVSFQSIIVLGLKISALTVGAILIGHYGFRKLGGFVERNLETDFMPLFTIGVALLYAGFALVLGLSEVLGAFLAGVMLSETGRSKNLEHLALPVRDITLPFFFFYFGTTIMFGEEIPVIGMFFVLIVWSIIAKLLVGYYGGMKYGLNRRVALRAGFSLVQRGEFSAIIAAMAAPPLRVFSGIYILVTATIGVLMFSKAPFLAKKGIELRSKLFGEEQKPKNNL